jgi:hypothetical protein
MTDRCVIVALSDAFFSGAMSTTLPLDTSLIGESKCGEVFQACPLSVTTATALRSRLPCQPGAASRRRVAGTHGAVARRGVTDTVCLAKQRCDRAEPLF